MGEGRVINCDGILWRYAAGAVLVNSESNRIISMALKAQLTGHCVVSAGMAVDCSTTTDAGSAGESLASHGTMPLAYVVGAADGSLTDLAAKTLDAAKCVQLDGLLAEKMSETTPATT